MSREETIMKEVEDCFEYFDKDGYDEEFLSTPSAENITDLIIIHEEEVLLDFVNYLNRVLKGNINETVNILWIGSQLTKYLKEKEK